MLAEAVRQGYHVVATEPAAALCLMHEYPQLLDDDDARLVAAHSSEACTLPLENAHPGHSCNSICRPVNADPGLSYAVPSQGAAASARPARTCWA